MQQSTQQQHPLVVFTAGRPSGKRWSGQCRRIKLSDNAVVIDSDVQRENIPCIRRFKEQYPLRWSGESHPVAKAYAEGLRDLSIEG